MLLIVRGLIGHNTLKSNMTDGIDFTQDENLTQEDKRTKTKAKISGPERTGFELKGLEPAASIGEDILSQFGNRVRALRHTRGLSQEAMALECELDRTYLGGIERGRRNVSLYNIQKIAGVLNLSLSELFEGIKP